MLMAGEKKLLLILLLYNVNIFEKMFNIKLMLIALIICIKSVVKPIIVYVVTYDMS